ncbi:uncharacterized protein B0J16DRAFT_334377 [Fusarium flagelliforme]|uniref:uncharacterized protein n=1 Tax=Fusarium flagelliforme TaxID=2675880 RepID=UPI001E8EA119|nr:uncharacterized protein B0J16DRAFT_334377 [Fusarium flagelliforme]KAH7193092.1 hypothetical protein B0J16DRAFT_334377 [Fusarium flagelliforme]
MLRQSVRGVNAPLRAFGQPAQQAAWNGAWRRLFTSQSGNKTGRQLLRWRIGSVPWEGMMGRLRNARFASRTTTPNMLQGVLRRGFRFSTKRKTNKGPAVGKTDEATGLTARLKKLTREYGWVTVGVYLGLSVLDFPFCFLFVRMVGAEKIGEVEHRVMSAIKQMIPDSLRETWQTYWQSFRKAEARALGDDDISDKMEMATWGVEKAQERNRVDASLATQLALAYAIHKSFIFIRVPLTAAVTPKAVKVLRSWGWNIGKKKA